MPFTVQLNRLRRSLNKRKHLNLSVTLTTFPHIRESDEEACTLPMNPIILVQGFIRIGMLSDPSPSIIYETQIILARNSFKYAPLDKRAQHILSFSNHIAEAALDYRMGHTDKIRAPWGNQICILQH